MNLLLFFFCSNKVTQLTSENRALKKKRRVDEKDVGRRPPEGKPRNTKSFLYLFFPPFHLLIFVKFGSFTRCPPPFLSSFPSFITSSFNLTLTLLPSHSIALLSFPFVSCMFSFQSSVCPPLIACWYLLAGNVLLTLSALSITYHNVPLF